MFHTVGPLNRILKIFESLRFLDVLYLYHLYGVNKNKKSLKNR